MCHKLDASNNSCNTLLRYRMLCCIMRLFKDSSRLPTLPTLPVCLCTVSL